MDPDEWERTEGVLVQAWTAGRLQDALSQIDRVMLDGNDSQRATALMYRGSMREEAADWEAAKVDFIRAATMSAPGSYQRYTSEVSAGVMSDKAGDPSDAVKWYRSALMTCLNSTEPFSGASAVKALLAAGSEMSPGDRQLVTFVTLRSCEVLGCQDRADLDDLAGTAEMLLRRASDPNW